MATDKCRVEELDAVNSFSQICTGKPQTSRKDWQALT